MWTEFCHSTIAVYIIAMFKVGSVVSSPVNAQYFVLEALTSYRGFGSENQVITYKK